MADIKPWYPVPDTSKVFSDHGNPTLTGEPPLRIPLANEDSAPLQGTKDLSDADSLEDVIASSYSPEAATEPALPTSPSFSQGKH